MKVNTMDFSALRERAIHLAEKMAGETWTDFNEHDPGVTILEQLCYALTDLGYRTEFNTEDLLANRSDQLSVEIDSVKTGDNVLTCRPLLDKDFSKLLFDQITGVKNAWLIPAPSADGTFEVQVEIFQTDQADQERIKNDVWNALMQHRNVGEDVARVVFLKRVQAVVDAKIEIGYEEDADTVLAQLIYNLQNQLVPFPSLSAFDVLLKEGYTPDEIFKGPLFSLGVYKEDQFGDKPGEINETSIRKIIREVPGVRDIVSLACYRDGHDKGGIIQLKKDEVPALRMDANEEIDLKSIKLMRGGRVLSVDNQRVYRKIRSLRQQQLRSYIYTERTLEDEAYRHLPEGNDRQVGRYHSIQHQFPITYGLSKFGVPREYLAYFDKAGSIDRTAQSHNLKAYLLFFEQQINNYLAQLAGLKKFFSLDYDLSRSYFSQTVQDIEGIEGLLQNYEDYEDDLEALTARYDRYHKRRSRTLNHLLGRYNEKFYDQLLDDFDVRKSGKKDNFHKELARWKAGFLRQYKTHSSERVAGFNYTSPTLSIQVVDASRRVLLRVNIRQGEIHERVEAILKEGQDISRYQIQRVSDDKKRDSATANHVYVRVVLLGASGKPVAYGADMYREDGLNLAVVAGRIAEVISSLQPDASGEYAGALGGLEILQYAEEGSAILLRHDDQLKFFSVEEEQEGIVSGSSVREEEIADWPHTSGIEKRASWQLGTAGHEKHSPENNSSETQSWQPGAQYVSKRLVESLEGNIYTFDHVYESKSSDVSDWKKEGLVFKSVEQSPLSEVIKFGMSADHYLIAVDEKRERKFQLYFRLSGLASSSVESSAALLGMYDTLEEAQEESKAIRAQLEAFERDVAGLYKGEGFYLVEHILLRLIDGDNEAQDVILSEDGAVLLDVNYLQDEAVEVHQRTDGTARKKYQDATDQLIEWGLDESNYLWEQRSGNQFRLVLYSGHERWPKEGRDVEIIAGEDTASKSEDLDQTRVATGRQLYSIQWSRERIERVLDKTLKEIFNVLRCEVSRFKIPELLQELYDLTTSYLMRVMKSTRLDVRKVQDAFTDLVVSAVRDTVQVVMDLSDASMLEHTTVRATLEEMLHERLNSGKHRSFQGTAYDALFVQAGIVLSWVLWEEGVQMHGNDGEDAESKKLLKKLDYQLKESILNQVCEVHHEILSNPLDYIKNDVSQSQPGNELLEVGLEVNLIDWEKVAPLIKWEQMFEQLIATALVHARKVEQKVDQLWDWIDHSLQVIIPRKEIQRFVADRLNKWLRGQLIAALPVHNSAYKRLIEEAVSDLVIEADIAFNFNEQIVRMLRDLDRSLTRRGQRYVDEIEAIENHAKLHADTEAQKTAMSRVVDAVREEVLSVLLYLYRAGRLGEPHESPFENVRDAEDTLFAELLESIRIEEFEARLLGACAILFKEERFRNVVVRRLLKEVDEDGMPVIFAGSGLIEALEHYNAANESIQAKTSLIIQTIVVRFVESFQKALQQSLLQYVVRNILDSSDESVSINITDLREILALWERRLLERGLMQEIYDFYDGVRSEEVFHELDQLLEGMEDFLNGLKVEVINEEKWKPALLDLALKVYKKEAIRPLLNTFSRMSTERQTGSQKSTAPERTGLSPANLAASSFLVHDRSEEHVEAAFSLEDRLRKDRDAAFYKHKISVFFPMWPARFHNPDFRTFAEHIVRENTPAHLSVDCYWLSPGEMRGFEDCYFSWVEAKANGPRGVPAVNDYAHNLKAFILGQRLKNTIANAIAITQYELLAVVDQGIELEDEGHALWGDVDLLYDLTDASQLHLDWVELQYKSQRTGGRDAVAKGVSDKIEKFRQCIYDAIESTCGVEENLDEHYRTAWQQDYRENFDVLRTQSGIAIEELRDVLKKWRSTRRILDAYLKTLEEIETEAQVNRKQKVAEIKETQTYKRSYDTFSRDALDSEEFIKNTPSVIPRFENLISQINAGEKSLRRQLNQLTELVFE